jgi:hypothetical protein
MDGLKTQRPQSEKQHSGVQTPLGRFYAPLTDAMARFSSNLYDIARSAPRR